MHQRKAAKIFINTGSCIIKAEPLVRQRSRGQCNIVDDRKLVSAINNDKNKRRWDSWNRTFRSRTATNKNGGFPSCCAKLSRPQDMKEALRAARISFNARRFCWEKKSLIQYLLFLCLYSQVFFWDHIGELRVCLKLHKTAAIS